MRTIRDLLLSLLLIVPLAQAKSPAPSYSMDATGKIEIGPDGAVREFEIDPGLPKAVRGLIKESVPNWRFEPVLVAGRAVVARTRMTLELSAHPSGDDQYRIQLDNAWFGTPQQRGKIKLPRYPKEAMRAGFGARVLLHAKLDAQGNVTDVHAYQTSLSRDGYTGTVNRLRERFEAASLLAAKQWKYDPAELIDGEASGITVTIPISFELTPMDDAENRWQSYIPGPITPAPWVDANSVAAQQTDGLADGAAAALDSRFKLLSNVIGKAL